MELEFTVLEEYIAASVKLDLIRAYAKSHGYISKDDLLMLLGESEEETND